jgi:hypothetical protein
MTTFDKRKEAYENKFARDAELRFKATARRNKLLGLWAAEKLGKRGDEAQAYARDVVRADLKEAGEDDVLAKVRGDLEAAGIGVAEQELRATMESLMGEAVAQLEADG